MTPASRGRHVPRVPLSGIERLHSGARSCRLPSHRDRRRTRHRRQTPEQRTGDPFRVTLRSRSALRPGASSDRRREKSESRGGRGCTNVLSIMPAGARPAPTIARKRPLPDVDDQLLYDGVFAAGIPPSASGLQIDSNRPGVRRRTLTSSSRGGSRGLRLCIAARLTGYAKRIG